jgi:hypothetical protein
MKSKLLTAWLLLALVFLAPAAVWSADGSACTTNRNIGGNYNAACVLLCDSKVAADDPATCTQYQFKSAPDIIQVEIAEDDACSAAATVTFTTQSDTGSDAHTQSTWTLTRGGTTAVVIEGASAQSLAYLNTTAATLTDCTDFDVKMHLYYKR